MKSVVTEAIILKRINFSEADRIVTVITPNNGKLSLLAKGVRKSNSKLAGGLEIFSINELTYIDGRGEIKTVISTRIKEHYKNIVSDVATTMVAYDILKIADDHTQHTSEAEYFEVLHKALYAVNEGEVDVHSTFLWYAMRILNIAGSGINLEKPLNSQKFSESSHYEFSYDDMAFYQKDNGQFSPNQIKLLKIASYATKPELLQKVTNLKELSKEPSKTLKQVIMMHRA